MVDIASCNFLNDAKERKKEKTRCERRGQKYEISTSVQSCFVLQNEGEDEGGEDKGRVAYRRI